MAYIRTDRNCNSTTQPGKLSVVDCYGNTNDFFHVDYKRRDRDNGLNPIPFDPNNPQNTVHDNPDVLFFDTDWVRKLVNNSNGTVSPFVDSPLNSGVTDIYVPPEVVYLAAEEDSDLVLTDEAGDDLLQVAYTGPLATTLS